MENKPGQVDAFQFGLCVNHNNTYAKTAVHIK